MPSETAMRRAGVPHRRATARATALTTALTTALATSVAALTAPAAAAAQNRIFYVDFAGGDDKADGRSPATAWQRGPWDAASTGAARRLVLQPGDTFRFKGGVRYRGQMAPRGVGTDENPIVFDGSSWGLSRAIFDGSEPLGGVRRCTSAADCLQSPHWRNLWRADVPATASWTDWLFVGDQPLQPAQYPSLSQDESDDVSRFLTIPRAELAALQAGSIRQALPAGLDAGPPVLALWAQPNVLGYTADVRVSKTGLDFAGANWVNGGLNPYTDRDNRFSIVNAPMMVNRAGLFAMSPRHGVVIFWPNATLVARTPQPSIGAGRMALNVGSLDGAVIRGFSFANFAAKPKNYASGTAILSNSNVDRLTVADNAFRAFVNLGNGMGVVHVVGGTGLVVKRNQFQQMPATSAIVVDNAPGPVFVQCNKIADIGRTGIRFNNVVAGRILANDIRGLNGIHGNGISAYNDVREVVIAGNVVVDTLRPLTVHGTATQKFSHGTPGVRVVNNVFISTSADAAAITSYGKTPNFVVENNFLSAPRFALRLNGSETGFSATGNTLVGGVNVASKAALFDPGRNTQHSPDGNGALLTTEQTRATVAPGDCR